MAKEFSYDAVPYPSKFFLQTHPDRLAAAGLLYGMQPTPVERCRVLELGCGNGSNLISHAYGLPNAQFFGIDLSKTHIDQATVASAELQLSNIEFRQMDVMEISADEFGKFDYITAHGLFSWVPEPVRDKILSIYEEMLTEHGIGYVSYNAYPGAFAREMVRSVMLHHTSEISEPGPKVEGALSFLKFLAEHSTERDVYARILDFESRRHANHYLSDIFHDDLAESYQSFYFHEFVELLKTNGLQFLSEAEIHASGTQGISEAAAEFVDSIEDHVKRDQYLDLLRGRIFRQTLFCRDSIRLDRNPDASVMDSFHISSSLRPVSQTPDLASASVEKFVSVKGQQLQIDHPVTKTALLILGQVWGKSVRVPDLLQIAKGRLVEAGWANDDWENQFAVARTILLKICLSCDLIELHTCSPPEPIEPGEQPKVNRLSRWQIRDAGNVLTLLNKDLKLEDETARHLLKIMDGTRDRAEIVREMRSFVRSASGVSNKEDLIRDMREWVDASIGELGRLGLFES